LAVALLDGHMPVRDGFALAERVVSDGRDAGLKGIMLTSAAQPEDITRCRRLGISQHLTKPIKQSELFDVIVNAMAPPLPEKSLASGRRKTARSAKRRLQVLIAEDNPVNQLVATGIFEKLGYQVTVVSHGGEALAAVQVRKFDLIAMDVQMPEMDGLEATKAIRAGEKSTGTHTPIVAMTAHAMKGDRERCLAAGMDAYLSKPMRIGELEEVIDQLISPSRAVLVPASVTSPGDVVDQAALLAGVDGDRRLLRHLVRLFLADYPQRLAEIKQAIRRGDARGLAKTAHTLKGSIGIFAARNAIAAAQNLESVGRDGKLGNASPACAALEAELALLGEELRKLTTSRSIPGTKNHRVGTRKRGGMPNR